MASQFRREQAPAAPWCGGCGDDVAPACAGSLARRGVLKVHWECWSECNLPCPFCFRTRGVPLATPDAVRLVAAVATGGARTIAFAGGDPSLRDDLGTLVALAQAAGLRVEVQTNAQVAPPPVQDALHRADRVCLSLDGPSPEVHDRVRGRRGNFRRVVAMAATLGDAGVPITVRTLITRQNAGVVAEVGPLVARMPTCERWTLLEFTPVGEGFAHRADYELEPGAFEAAVGRIAASFDGSAELDVFRHAGKIGAYVQVTPDGGVYGTSAEALLVTGAQEVVGSILTDHLADLADRVPFDPARHRYRYASEVTPAAVGDRATATRPGGRP